MKKTAPSLEVTYRHGQPFAAYHYLPREAGDKVHRSRRAEPGLVIDLNRRGRAIGIEITAPKQVTVAALDRVLRESGQPPITEADLAPLQAA